MYKNFTSCPSETLWDFTHSVITQNKNVILCTTEQEVSDFWFPCGVERGCLDTNACQNHLIKVNWWCQNNLILGQNHLS